jgi:hypothetical protein
MLERLTNPDEMERAVLRISELIEAHAEWFYTLSGDATAATLALRRSEIDLQVAQGRLIFSCWTEKGLRFWRVHAWQWTGAKPLLEMSRRAGAEHSRIELIPRVSTDAINRIISAARRERAKYLARLATGLCAEGTKIERVGLSAGVRRNQPGRYARIQLRRSRERIIVTGVVTPNEAHDVDAFLSSALIWFTRARERTRPPLIQKLWLISDRKHIEALAESVALLKDQLRRMISLYEIDDDWRELKPVRCPLQEDLWAAPLAPLRRRPALPEPSAWAARIMALAPDAIDVVRARHGETLRYQGLAFARVRRVMNIERVWFGVAGTRRRRLLDESTAAEWDNLLGQLGEHRRAEAANRRHALYRAAPEAWLESMLRRDITQLDPGLIVAPLYAQFRASQTRSTSARPVDLLALRCDGRLVVIELKVSEDREHVLQGANYWRRVEAHRRWGNLARAQLFGDAVISDEPPLVYLVAPTLRFHRAFGTLAHAIDPRIELYRFDLNEDWRAGVRVTRRTVT